MTSQTMKAVRIHSYGGPEVLTYEDIPVPTPGEGEVLVRVFAAGINAIDSLIRSGAAKDFEPVELPFTLGFDLAGTVEAVGPDVTSLVTGDAVYGEGRGTFSQFATAPAATLAPNPTSLTFGDAASVPNAACTAWQGLFDYGGLEAGQTLLVHGAAGGVGTFAVQLAKWKGARVIGTASGNGIAYVKTLGAESVIDYKTQRFENEVKDVDVVLDLIGGDTQTRSYAILKRGGILVSTVSQPSEQLAASYGVRATTYSMTLSPELLTKIGGLLNAGQIRTVVSRTIDLSNLVLSQQTPSGSVLGKSIVLVRS